jgi:DeoR family glycerol-3-phosphate regulon repressor
MPANPALSDRQAAILDRIAAQGFVTLEALAEAFAVSMQTVRRDVIALAEAGLVVRFHGGAGRQEAPAPQRQSHAARSLQGLEAKRRIAAAAAAMAGAEAHVFLDVGTTAETVAAALAAGPPLMVVTNSLNVAAAFDPARHRVRVLPGMLTGPDGSLTGPDTCAALARLRLDLAFIGASGVEPAGAVVDFDAGKIAVKRTAMEAARRAVLIAAADKWGRTAREEIAPLARFDDVLTGEG